MFQVHLNVVATLQFKTPDISQLPFSI